MPHSATTLSTFSAGPVKNDQLAGSAGASPESSKAGSNEATGKITVAKPDKAAPAASGDQLKIAKSDGGKAGVPGGKGSQDQVNALKEEIIAKDNQTKEASSRVKDLEKQIADMHKLAEMKSMAAKTDAVPQANVAK